ncbi:MAG TPA: response regulator [Caulobacteraceae bacterium]|nr:response regulator [Caulobacteraceae bacterium]
MSIDLPTEAQTLKRSPASPGLRVLTVEDDEADAYLIRRALADNPAVGQVVHACDGIEAITMIENGLISPDLAFIDLRMPRMDGFDLLVTLAGRAEHGFPMVVLTSSASPGDAIRSRLRSAIRVITKPTTIVELYTVLEAAIEATCPGGVKPADTGPRKNPGFPLMGKTPSGLRRI